MRTTAKAEEKSGKKEEPLDEDAGAEASGREEQVRERRPLNALVVLEVIRREGEEELARPTRALAFSGLAAGLSMGFSLVAEGMLRSMLPDAPWRPIVTKLGYSVGFLIVILGRQQLFTENTLTPIIPLMTNRDGKTLFHVARLWLVVLAANLLGAFCFAWTVGHTDVFSLEVKGAFRAIGLEAMAGTAGSHFLRGIFAGWLIALIVWLMPSADQTRLQTILLLSYLVGLAQLSHIVIGSVESFYVVTTGAASWAHYWTIFMVPTLLGNILGGTTLVAALNFGQATPKQKDAE